MDIRPLEESDIPEVARDYERLFERSLQQFHTGATTPNAWEDKQRTGEWLMDLRNQPYIYEALKS